MKRFGRSWGWLWLAYLLAPVGGWGLFHARPLDLWATAALAIVLWVWFSGGLLRLRWVVAVGLVAKVTLGTTLILPRGFEARYFANATFSGQPEPGTESADRWITRIDERLQFGAAEARDLPLAFLNDSSRFNFYLPEQPDQATLPFSVTWKGMLRVSTSGSQRIYIRAPGATVKLTVGDRTPAVVSPGVEGWTDDVPLQAGFHPIAISLSVVQGVARRFEAGRLVGGREEPFDSDDVFRRVSSRGSLVVDRVVRLASRGVDILLGGWLAFSFFTGLRGAYRRLRTGFNAHDALSVVWAVAIGDALVFALPVLNRMVILSGGNDWLSYETMARDIGLNGPWMAGGASLGHGNPFYMQPLYPYFVAACHWLWGEGLFGVHLVQRALVAATVVALWRTTAEIFDEGVGLAGLLAAGVLVYEKFAFWAGVLLSEVLFVPLLCLWTLEIVRFAADRIARHRRAMSVGLLGGVATLTRSTLLLGWVLALPVLAFVSGRSKRRWSMLAVLLLTMVSVTSLATVRNWVVAGKFVPIASSGPINLYLGNQPTTALATPPEHKAMYDRLGIEPYTQMVVEYLRQRPRAFFDGLLQKALFALGWFERLEPGSGLSFFYVAFWAIALVGTAFALSRRTTLPRSVVAIPLLLALAHYVAVVVIFPHGYGDRLIQPFYALLVPYVAVAVAKGYWLADRVGARPVSVALWIAAIGGLAWRASAGVRLDVDMFTITVMLTVVCLSGLPDLTARRTWPYAACATTLGVWLSGTPTPDAAATCRLVWLLLAADLLSNSLATAPRALSRAATAIIALCSVGPAIMALRAVGELAMVWREGIGGIGFAAARALAAALVLKLTWRAVALLLVADAAGVAAMRASPATPRPGGLRRAAAACLVIWGASMATKALTWELAPTVHVRWRADLTAQQQEALERRFMLARTEHTAATTWAYDLLDLSKSNVVAIVGNDRVEDTSGIDRVTRELSRPARAGTRETWLLYRLPFPRYPLLVDWTPTLLLIAVGGLYLADWGRRRRGAVGGPSEPGPPFRST